MKTKQLNSTLKSIVSTNNGLSSYLFHLTEGRAATPHSWLYEDKPSEIVLNEWISILEKVKSLKSYGTTIFQFDYKQVEKFGPQGQIPPIREAIETLGPSYDRSEQLPIQVHLYESENQQIASELFGARLMTKRPLGYQAVVDDMRERDTLSTNSGIPDFGRRNKPEILSRAIQDAMTGQAYEYPAIILFRAYNGKLRPVWMFPMSMNLIEGSFTQVIQDTIRSNGSALAKSYVSPWEGFEVVKRKFTTQWNGTFAAGGDTTAMDAHFGEDKMNCVFNVVKYCFQQRYWEELWRCMRHVNDIDILTGQNEMLTGPHGVASGSGWTQLAETVYQYIMFWHRRKRGAVAGQGIGDDFVWFLSRSMTGKDLAHYLLTWGLPANDAKQSTEKDQCSFLQRLFLRGFVSREDKSVLGGVYPTIRALNSSLHPERFHNASQWNSDMFCIRQFMILENTVDHPMFEEFCRFVVAGQRDLLPFAKKSSEELDTILKESRALPGLNPSYNQEKMDKPLSAFASIQFAATL